MLYYTWPFYVAKATFFKLVQLIKRPFCKHADWVKCYDDIDIGDNLLMDQKFEIVCERCGKRWMKTTWEIINTPLKEW